ncbi:MAG: hypothetical protein ABR992_07845 [Solirubrobacteraceae bacterium]|jgi:hypothetical protein
MSETGKSRLPPRERGRPLCLRSDKRSGATVPALPAESAHDDTALEEQHSRAYTCLLVGIRYVLPAVVTLCGLVFMALGGETDLEGGASLVSAGLAIYFVNWLYRIGVQGDRERDTEEAARDYFARHGRWPS